MRRLLGLLVLLAALIAPVWAVTAPQIPLAPSSTAELAGKWKLREQPAKRLVYLQLLGEHLFDTATKSLDSLMFEGKAFPPSLMVSCDDKGIVNTVSIATFGESEPTSPGYSTVLVTYDGGEQLVVLARDATRALVLQGPQNAPDINGRNFTFPTDGSSRTLTAHGLVVLDRIKGAKSLVVKWVPKGRQMLLADFDVRGLAESARVLEGRCGLATK